MLPHPDEILFKTSYPLELVNVVLKLDTAISAPLSTLMVAAVVNPKICGISLYTSCHSGRLFSEPKSGAGFGVLTGIAPVVTFQVAEPVPTVRTTFFVSDGAEEDTSLT